MFIHFGFHDENRNRKQILARLLPSFIFTFLYMVVCAQESVNPSGGNAIGTGGNVSYSVGQVVYTTYSGTNGSVAQGVQQPYEISVITAIEEAKDINLVCTAYPNPTNDLLKLKIENFNKENLTYQLYDIKGNLLENNIIKEDETVVSIGRLSAGVYFVRIVDKSKEIKVFKIIKNQ